MHSPIQRRRVLRAGVAIGLGLVLPSARAHEYFVPHIRISHPWCRETAVDAAFAAVYMTFDEVTRSDRLIGVETPVAEAAVMVGPGMTGAVDLPIVEGQETTVGEAGVQIRLVRLTQALLVARSYPLKLMFAKSGEVDATLDVAFPAS